MMCYYHCDTNDTFFSPGHSELTPFEGFFFLNVLCLCINKHHLQEDRVHISPLVFSMNPVSLGMQ